MVLGFSEVERMGFMMEFVHEVMFVFKPELGGLEACSNGRPSKVLRLLDEQLLEVSVVLVTNVS
jgi:hypothetical protein